jgi:hypothetical protein
MWGWEGTHMITRTPLLAILLTLGTLAHAQGVLGGVQGDQSAYAAHATLDSGALSSDEERYVQSVSVVLGKGVGKGQRIRMPYTSGDLEPAVHLIQLGEPQAPPAPVRTARGVRVSVGEASVERLRFRSADEAQRFAIYAADTTRYPHSIEVRGRQMVIVHGDVLRDPARAAKLRDAVWGTLPHAPGTPAVAATFLAPQEFFLETHIKNKELDGQIDRAISASKKKVAEGGERAEGIEVNGDRVNVEMGFKAELERTSEGGYVWFAKDPKRAEGVASYATDFRATSAALAAKSTSKDQGQSTTKGDEQIRTGAGSRISSEITKPIK